MRYLLTAVVFIGAAYAQTRDTAAVFGTVTDAQGSAIPGAVVKLTNLSTGQARSATAGASGEYLFSSVLVGTYSLTAEQPSFKRSERTGILLQANENVKVDVSLEVGDVKTTVSVDAAASQVEVRSSTIKETVDRARVVELPLNGRNAADLACWPPVSPHSAAIRVISAAVGGRGARRNFRSTARATIMSVSRWMAVRTWIA